MAQVDLSISVLMLTNSFNFSTTSAFWKVEENADPPLWAKLTTY